MQFIYKCFDEGFTGANESGDGKTVESGNDMTEDSRNASLSDFLKSSHYTYIQTFVLPLVTWSYLGRFPTRCFWPILSLFEEFVRLK